MQLYMAVWMWRSIIPGITVWREQSIASDPGGALSRLFSPTLRMRLPWMRTTAFLSGFPPRPSISVPQLTAFTGPLGFVSRNSCDFMPCNLLSSETLHGLQEIGVGPRIEGRSGPDRRQIESVERALQLGALHIAGDEHDAGPAIGIRPDGERDRLVHDGLHGMDDDRLALHVEEALHPEEVRS